MTMAQFVRRPATKAVRQVLLNASPMKWTAALYEMQFIIVAAAGNYKGGFENITQDACDMFSAKILSGLIGPLQKKVREKKRAREAKFREIHSKTKHWTILQ